MATALVPRLVSNLIPTKFIPAGIARTADPNMLATARGAASGVAALDAGAALVPDQVPTGSVILVRYSGSWPASRPTARTDVTVWAVAPSSISTSDLWTASAPSWLIDNDRFEIRD